MPTMDRLADNGLTYSQWHTTALCSPTRSTFLTGRNHHLNGFATISESSTGFPGYNSHIPPENATMANVLRDAGWSTFWVGKNHNVPIDEWTMGASKKNWPLGAGLRPLLRVHRRRDQQLVSEPGRGQPLHRPALPARGRLPPVEGPGRPGAAVHPRLEADRARQALVPVVLPGRQPRPAPRARRSTSPSTRATFDDGYEAYREWVLPRMIERGILPEGTELTPMNPMPEGTFTPTDAVRPWDELDDAEKAMFSPHGRGLRRVLASTPTPRSAASSTTSRSRASSTTRSSSTAPTTAPPARAAPTDRSTRARSSAATPTTSSRTWRWSTSSDRRTPTTTTRPGGRWPSRRRTACSSATRTRAACATRWSSTGRPASRRRARYATSTTTRTDIVPTIYDVCGVEMPDVYDGAAQNPLSGVSMRYSFDAADAPTEKHTQYYEMLGSRGIWHDGWKAVTEHGPMSGRSNFDQDRWQLFHTDDDRSEAHDLADEHPDKVEELKALWFAGGRGQRRAARSTTCRSSAPEGLRDVHRHGVPHPRAAERAVHVLPGHERGPRAVGRQRPRRVVQGAGRGRPHPREPGGDLRPRLTLRRPRAVHQGRHRSPTPTTSWASRPRTASRPPCRRRASTSSASSSPRSAWASTARASGRSSCTSTTRWSPRTRSAR